MGVFSSSTSSSFVPSVLWKTAERIVESFSVFGNAAVSKCKPSVGVNVAEAFS